MHVKTYQNKIKRYWKTSNDVGLDVCHALIGMSGEMGEVSEPLKKALFKDEKLNKKHLTEELGDVLFYVITLANILDIDMTTCLNKNIDKLEGRRLSGKGYK